MNPVAIDLLLNATFAKDIHKKDRTVTSQMNKILKFMQESMGAGNKVTPFGIIPGIGPDGEEVVKGFRFLTGNAQSAQKAVSDVNEYLNRMSEGLYENSKRFWGAAQINESAKLFETGSAHVLTADIKSFLKQLSNLGGSVLSTNDVIGGQTINYQVPTSRAWGSEASASTLMGGVASGYESGYKEFLRVRKNQRARELYAQRKAEEAARKAWWADYGSVELSDWKGYVADAERARKLEQRQAQERRAAIAYGVELRERGLEDADFSAVGNEGYYDWDVAEEAAKKRNTGYISEAELISQEERRRQLGIVTDEGSSIAKEQEQTGYFNKSLLYFAAITETVRRILGFVTKIYDNALQLSYSAKAANVDADKLKALELALQGFKVDKGAAKSAIGLIAGGLMNPFQLNESLVGTIAPILGQSSADVVKNMLMGKGDTLGALTMIMEAARGKVASGGFTGTTDRAKAYAEVHKQLEAAGGGLESIFEAYMRAVDKDYELNKGVGDFGFSDFLRLFSVSGTENAADAALQKAYMDALIERNGLNYLFTHTYDPGKLWTTNKLDTNPYKNKLEFYDALQGFGVNPSADADTATLKDAVYGISSKGLSKDQQKILQRLKDTVNILDAWKGQKGTDYWESQGYDLPMPRRYSADGTLESMLQGTEPGLFGGTVYNEIDNSVNTSSAAGGGSMDISLNIRGGGKDMGTYPLEINANNMITIDYWS